MQDYKSDKYFTGKLLLGIVIFVVPLLICMPLKGFLSYTPTDDAVGVIPPLQDVQKIQQIFTPSIETISKVEVMIGTYERTNRFILVMEISQLGDNTVLASNVSIQ